MTVPKVGSVVQERPVEEGTATYSPAGSADSSELSVHEGQHGDAKGPKGAGGKNGGRGGREMAPDMNLALFSKLMSLTCEWEIIGWGGNGCCLLVKDSALDVQARARESQEKQARPHLHGQAHRQHIGGAREYNNLYKVNGSEVLNPAGRRVQEKME
jgi:hypothetical protein